MIKGAPCSLLSGPTSEGLGLIKMKDELLVNSLTANKELTKEDVLTEYKNVFHGLGYIGENKIERWSNIQARCPTKCASGPP